MPYPNFNRYKPSGKYFGRVRVNGKLIRRSLETHILTVAKLKLRDFPHDYRRLAINKGESVLGEVIIEMFRKEIEDDHHNKPRTKLHKQEVLTALKNSGRNYIQPTSPKSAGRIAMNGRFHARGKTATAALKMKNRTLVPIKRSWHAKVVPK